MVLKAGLVGCGRMGAHSSDRVKATFTPCWLPLSHAESMVAVDGIDLACVCDVVAESAESTAALYGVGAHYTDYREMIRKERPDILAIATRTPQRVEIIKFAAANGVKGIHIEKPVAQTLGECQDAMEAMDKYGVVASYGVYRRFHPAFKEAQGMILGGDVGELQEVTVDFRRSLLLWYHPHSIDIMLMFAGEAMPELVWGDCLYDKTNFQGDTLDEDPIVRHAYVRFDSGLNGTISQSGGMNVRLGGTEGLVEILRNGDETLLRTKETESDVNFSRQEVLPLVVK